MNVQTMKRYFIHNVKGKNKMVRGKIIRLVIVGKAKVNLKENQTSTE